MGKRYNETEFMLGEVEEIRKFIDSQPEMSESEAVSIWVKNNAKSYRENHDKMH